MLGGNLDWDVPIPGHVVASPPGIVKSLLPWKGNWPSTRAETRDVTWQSKYASITFTRFGRDFIEGGMNDAGLAIDQASLHAKYPPEDHRPGISCSQWMQYQLDNFATVDEVIENIESVRPDGEGWHYLLTDASGACAVIEHLDGAPLVHQFEAGGNCALTNTSHQRAVSHIALDRAFGGDLDIASGNDSYGRFVRMLKGISDYEPSSNGRAADYAFTVLDSLRADDTLRSVVYDVSNGRVTWKTPEGEELHWLDFKTLAMVPGGPVRHIDVDTADTGDLVHSLQESSYEANLDLVTRVVELELEYNSAGDRPQDRGLAVETVVELIASNPEYRGGTY